MGTTETTGCAAQQSAKRVKRSNAQKKNPAEAGLLYTFVPRAPFGQPRAGVAGLVSLSRRRPVCEASSSSAVSLR